MVAQDALSKELVDDPVTETHRDLQRSEGEHDSDGALDARLHLDIPQQDSRQN